MKSERELFQNQKFLEIEKKQPTPKIIIMPTDVKVQMKMSCSPFSIDSVYTMCPLDPISGVPLYHVWYHETT